MESEASKVAASKPAAPACETPKCRPSLLSPEQSLARTASTKSSDEFEGKAMDTMDIDAGLDGEDMVITPDGKKAALWQV